MAKEFKVHNIDVPFGALIKVGQNPNLMADVVSLQVMMAGDTNDTRWFEIMLDIDARRSLIEALNYYEKEE